MSSRRRFLLPVIFFALVLLAACGSSPKVSTPPPTGSFSNASLNGTYVIAASGSDGNGFFSTVGVLTANGSGAFTGGSLDFNDPANLLTNQAVGGNSTYKITSDGRGTAIIGTPSATFTFDFVLTSSSHGLVTRYDTAGTGSGSLDLQSSVTQAQLAGSYVMDFVGVDSAGASLGTVGAFTLDAAGTISAGVQDINDNKFAYPNLALAGSVVLSSTTSTTPGIATLTTTSAFGSLTFDVFPIDATHLRFIETDTHGIMAGDAFSQASMPTAGNLVFTASGIDSGGFALVTGGQMAFDGNLTITSGIEDINDAGSVSPAPISFAGSVTALSGGRSTLTLTGFDNGTVGTTTFAAYPSSGGIHLLEIDDAGTTGGVAFQQSATALTSGQGYGLNLSGVNSSGEEDDIAEFTNTSGALAGLVDFNDSGTLTFDQTFTATYTADTTNAGRGTIASSSFNLVSYVVDSSTSLFVEMDSTQVGLGTYQQQTPTAQSNIAAARLAVFSLNPSARKAMHHHR
jgi:hypothetical protein